MSSNLTPSATATPDRLSVRVRRKVEIADQIFLFELVREDGQDLPPFDAGAHLTVETPNGQSRHYSLCNAPGERNRYQIAVKRDVAGTGGSVNMVDAVQTGSLLRVSPPENYFPLAHTASRYLLIAGGIGITPILAMMHELQARGADFKVIYCTRAPASSAFLDELNAPQWAQRVTVHHDHGDPARLLELAPLLADAPPDTHIYCCGPRPLMQAVREQTAHWPSGSVHFEDFGTSARPASEADQTFTVRLARSGIDVQVPPDKTILTALRECGIAVPSSCESGTCGSCRTRLLAGEVEHRDFVLDDDEYASNIMICVSRARSKELVLDV